MYKAIRARQLPVGVVALVVFLVGGLVQTVRAQDGGWVEWARQTIENDYAISGGELIIGGEDIVPSYTVGDAPVAVSAAEEGFPFTVDEYLHFEHPTAEANWYDAGPRYLNNLAVEAGDQGGFGIVRRKRLEHLRQLTGKWQFIERPARVAPAPGLLHPRVQRRRQGVAREGGEVAAAHVPGQHLHRQRGAAEVAGRRRLSFAHAAFRGDLSQPLRSHPRRSRRHEN